MVVNKIEGRMVEEGEQQEYRAERSVHVCGMKESLWKRRKRDWGEKGGY